MSGVVDKQTVFVPAGPGALSWCFAGVLVIFGGVLALVWFCAGACVLVCRFPCVLFCDLLTIVQVRWHCVGLLVCRLVVCLLLCGSDTAHTADLWSWVQGFRGKLEAQKFNSITLFEILNGLCTLGIQKESTTYLHWPLNHKMGLWPAFIWVA